MYMYMIIDMVRKFLSSAILQELGLYDIKFFDLELGKTLEEMQNLVERHRRLKASTRKTKQTLCFRGQNIEDLYLDFTLPGYPGHVLKPGGEDIMVNACIMLHYDIWKQLPFSKLKCNCMMNAGEYGEP